MENFDDLNGTNILSQNLNDKYWTSNIFNTVSTFKQLKPNFESLTISKTFEAFIHCSCFSPIVGNISSIVLRKTEAEQWLVTRTAYGLWVINFISTPNRFRTIPQENENKKQKAVQIHKRSSTDKQISQYQN